MSARSAEIYRDDDIASKKKNLTSRIHAMVASDALKSSIQTVIYEKIAGKRITMVDGTDELSTAIDSTSELFLCAYQAVIKAISEKIVQTPDNQSQLHMWQGRVSTSYAYDALLARYKQPEPHEFYLRVMTGFINSLMQLPINETDLDSFSNDIVELFLLARVLSRLLKNVQLSHQPPVLATTPTNNMVTQLPDGKSGVMSVQSSVQGIDPYKNAETDVVKAHSNHLGWRLLMIGIVSFGTSYGIAKALKKETPIVVKPSALQANPVVNPAIASSTPLLQVEQVQEDASVEAFAVASTESVASTTCQTQAIADPSIESCVYTAVTLPPVKTRLTQCWHADAGTSQADLNILYAAVTSTIRRDIQAHLPTWSANTWRVRNDGANTQITLSLSPDCHAIGVSLAERFYNAQHVLGNWNTRVSTSVTLPPIAQMVETRRRFINERQ